MNKKLWKVLALVLATASIAAFAACGGSSEKGSSEKESSSPEPVAEHEFFYTLKDDDTYDISGMTYGEKEQIAQLTIPAEYNGKAVTSISSLTSESTSMIYTCQITLPKSVTSISKNVFKELHYNTGSTKAVPNADNSNYIFKFIYTGTLTDWTKIKFGNDLSNPLLSIETQFRTESGSMCYEDATNAFYYDDGTGNSVELTKLETDVETVGAYQFAGMNSLKEIKLTGAKTIEHNAFNGCTSVNKITLDKAVEIGAFAFVSVKEAPELVLPDTIKYLGFDIFGCNAGVVPSTEIKFPTNSRWVMDTSKNNSYAPNDGEPYTSDGFFADNRDGSYASYIWIRTK